MLPTFETNRLILHERTPEDIDQCIELDCDPEVVKYIPEIAELIYGPEANKERHREFVRKRTEAIYPTGMGYWTIESIDTSREFIGWVMLIPIDNIGHDIEIGWRLKRSHWGKGYATEAAKIILHHAFDNVGLQNIVADIHYLNKGSIRVAEKIGFTIENRISDTTDNYVRYSIYNNYSYRKKFDKRC